MTEKPAFEIGADGVDVDGIVADVQATVEEKARQGAYDDPRLARAERTNLLNLEGIEDLPGWYLDALADAVQVDINDFEIQERRTCFSGVFVALKRLIWKMLRFYTYRLWSQQNQVNGLFFAAIEAMENRHRDKIATLEKRIAELESGD